MDRFHLPTVETGGLSHGSTVHNQKHIERRRSISSPDQKGDVRSLYFKRRRCRFPGSFTGWMERVQIPFAALPEEPDGKEIPILRVITETVAFDGPLFESAGFEIVNENTGLLPSLCACMQRCHAENDPYQKYGGDATHRPRGHGFILISLWNHKNRLVSSFLFQESPFSAQPKSSGLGALQPHKAG